MYIDNYSNYSFKFGECFFIISNIFIKVSLNFLKNNKIMN